MQQSPRWFQAEQTSTIRSAFGFSLVLVLLAVGFGYALGAAYSAALGPASEGTYEALLYSGIGVLLWATLGKGGWSIQTLDGDSLPEEVDEYLWGFRVSGGFPTGRRNGARGVEEGFRR